MSKLTEIGKFVGNVLFIDSGIEAPISAVKEYRRAHDWYDRDSAVYAPLTIASVLLALGAPTTTQSIREGYNAWQEAPNGNMFRELLLVTGILANFLGSVTLDLIINTVEIKQLTATGNVGEFLEQRALTSTAINTLATGYNTFRRKVSYEPH